ncbi:3-hydroxyacyl-CoA dehydrogenase NAD-binding domain-containing protein [Bradyrhizobium sp. Ash2021]|uniref:3-hydroxyacyl-CoA dehydrogenase NAD-binding domain-containing protein n=1 Tax=Bradyrhizobium sp. Ash2021 TaxID=2954771 RepID=UPI0028163D30|nr:3-hydroxyacyl-CoA dehydrogenase NAD-binding domain-containing protein [Bradyrhizobium sp. Ash2021]WMT77370.1 3-hydroxyacyl-CoA dehydrogenase NAD-binding domain-containing protein [Bradyrhizobium sp. Ash2021]
MNETASSDVLERYSTVAVIGAGVIGASWTAVFLAHGLTVIVNDPRDNVEAVVNDYIRKASPTLRALRLSTEDLTRKLRFEADLDRAVASADLVQENGPERVEFKQDLWARIEQHVPAHALLLSNGNIRGQDRRLSAISPSSSAIRESRDEIECAKSRDFRPILACLGEPGRTPD